MKICLGIPTNRGVKAKTVHSLLSLDRGGHEFFVIMATEGYTTAENRNYVAIQAKQNNCDYILFVDDDMIFPPDTFLRLLAHQKEIVGVNSNSRILPLSSTVAFMNEQGEYVPLEKMPPWWKPPESLFKCYSIGAGVLLIDMKVFDIIDKPWFATTNMDSGKILIGEDAWFCFQAKKKGIDIYCDPTLKIGHIGDYIY